MASYLCLSVRFLLPVFHGQRGDGAWEWPPSPMRVFQALVSAAGMRWRGQRLPDRVAEALRWLERLSAPVIVAPMSVKGTPYRVSVPNNDMDVIAREWARNGVSRKQPSELRTLKRVRRVHMLDGDTVSYLWPLPAALSPEEQGHVNTLKDVARSIVALGWGMDLVAGNGLLISEDEARNLSGLRWTPGIGGLEDGLRVPIAGSLSDLENRYRQFMQRVRPDGLTVPPPITVFETFGYRLESEIDPRPIASFALLRPDADGFRTFDTARYSLTVAGMVRGAVRRAAERSGWDPDRVNWVVLGHGQGKDFESPRFAYLPLPSIEHRGHARRVVGSVRRVLITAFRGPFEAEVDWAQRTLSGEPLVAAKDGKTEAILSGISENDVMVRQVRGTAVRWATVTPVVLPGYDDPAHLRRRLRTRVSSEEQKRLLSRVSERTDKLIRKAIVQSGFPRALAANALVEWSRTGFLPGVERADRYGIPDHLRRFPALHIRIEWRSEGGEPIGVPGPVVIGAGRYFGLGLFVPDD